MYKVSQEKLLFEVVYYILNLLKYLLNWIYVVKKTESYIDIEKWKGFC